MYVDTLCSNPYDRKGNTIKLLISFWGDISGDLWIPNTDAGASPNSAPVMGTSRRNTHDQLKLG